MDLICKEQVRRDRGAQPCKQVALPAGHGPSEEGAVPVVHYLLESTMVLTSSHLPSLTV